jgi:transposase
VRAAKVVETLLGITGIVVESAEISTEGVVFDVRPRRKKPRCSGCGKRAPGYDQREARQWRHLNLRATRIWLRYAPRRVECAGCGVVNEQVPWGSAGGWFSSAFEETTAYLARVGDKTSVTKIMGIAWMTVGKIVERIVGERLDSSRLDGLSFIGIDEFSYRKRHRYITVIVDHVTGRVVWAEKGGSSETLAAFFREVGPERAGKIEVVTPDMAEGFIKAVKEYAPQAKIVFDWFHVQRLASDAVDQVRRGLVRIEEDPERKQAIKGSRFALLRAEWNLTVEDRAKISEIQRSNRSLYRALAHLLGYEQAGRAKKALKEWLGWASRSRLRPFVRVARTIRNYRDGVRAYIDFRLTNGPVEGINSRLRTVARRAFGFHSAEALISMLFLCCSKIVLTPRPDLMVLSWQPSDCWQYPW